MDFGNIDDTCTNDSFDKMYNANKYKSDNTIEKINIDNNYIQKCSQANIHSSRGGDTIWIQTQYPCIDSTNNVNHENHDIIITHTDSLNTTHESFWCDWLYIFKCFFHCSCPDCSYPHCSCPDCSCPHCSCPDGNCPDGISC